MTQKAHSQNVVISYFVDLNSATQSTSKDFCKWHLYITWNFLLYSPLRLLTIVEMMTCMSEIEAQLHLSVCVCVEYKCTTGKDTQTGTIFAHVPWPLVKWPPTEHAINRVVCANWIGCQMFLPTNYPPLHAQGMSTLLLCLQSQSILHSWQTL